MEKCYWDFNGHRSNEYKRRLFNGASIGYCYCTEHGKVMTIIQETGKNEKEIKKLDKVVTKQNTSGH